MVQLEDAICVLKLIQKYNKMFEVTNCDLKHYTNQIKISNSLRSQFEILKNLSNKDLESGNINKRGKHSKYTAFAFTEQGVAMLSGILNSERAISVNIAIMRTFVQMRKLMFSNAELSQRVGDLERLMNEHLEDYGSDIQDIYEALRQLMRDQDEEEPRRPIGFK